MDADAGAPHADELAERVRTLEAELADLVLDGFTNADAHRLGLILLRHAQERDLPITVDVTRGDQVVFHAAMDGATADNDDWVRRKTRTVQRFGTASLVVGLRARAKGRPIEREAWFDERRYAAHGGCVPVVVRGVGMVATVTVSGLAQADDHALVVAALRELSATP